ncbi:MAG: hypothetical protein A4E57_00014 [Syntrophorhabdaceae bacterium PtaU1.Bin034]|jgi:hypothetical protein|nr:MAG: hypothetical protein A4E57_00014 [Syntrophorhabdaceae bacterium PtaU1.Bin034]
MQKLIILVLVLLLVSCSMPFGKKKAEAPATPQKSEKGEKVQETEAKPGDVKLVDGVEYIYAKNRRFQLTPYEPEYLWIRKDQYSPGLFESITAGSGKKEREELERRMAKLEEELKKKGMTPQMVYPVQMGTLPSMMPYMGSMPLVGFTYPSPKMKRRVLVLPLSDQTNYKEEHLDELTTKRLISRLENSGTVICVDPRAINISGDLTTPAAMKNLNESYGVQAIIRGSLSDVYTSTSKVEGKDEKEVSFALSKISLDVYNTETTKILRQFNARNPFFLTRERGDMSPEKAKVKAIDLAIELVADDLLKTILSLDWHARIASIEADNVFITAGRLSGLQKGDLLEVYSPGEQVIDKTTNLPLGRVKGNYKGELEVVEVFGVDASSAKIKKSGSFAPTDLVYLKK